MEYPTIYFGRQLFNSNDFNRLGDLRRFDLLSITSQFFYSHLATNIHEDTYIIRAYRDLPDEVLRGIEKDYRNGLDLFSHFLEIEIILPVILGRSLEDVRYLNFGMDFLVEQISLFYNVDLVPWNFGEPEDNKTIEFLLII